MVLTTLESENPYETQLIGPAYLLAGTRKGGGLLYDDEARSGSKLSLH